MLYCGDLLRACNSSRWSAAIRSKRLGRKQQHESSRTALSTDEKKYINIRLVSDASSEDTTTARSRRLHGKLPSHDKSRLKSVTVSPPSHVTASKPQAQNPPSPSINSTPFPLSPAESLPLTKATFVKLQDAITDPRSPRSKITMESGTHFQHKISFEQGFLLVGISSSGFLLYIRSRTPAGAPANTKPRPAAKKPKTTKKNAVSMGRAGSKRKHEDDGTEERDDPDNIDNNDGGGPTRYLACPFWKLDPHRHFRCFRRFEIKRFSDLALHLQRYHFLGFDNNLYYCTNCYETFRRGQEQQWDAHITSPCTHVSQPEHFLPGEIAEFRNMNLRGSDYDKWYAMWDRFWRGYPRPASPYAEAELEELLVNFGRDDTGLVTELPTILARFGVFLDPNDLQRLSQDIASVRFSPAQISPPPVARRRRQFINTAPATAAQATNSTLAQSNNSMGPNAAALAGPHDAAPSATSQPNISTQSSNLTRPVTPAHSHTPAMQHIPAHSPPPNSFTHSTTSVPHTNNPTAGQTPAHLQPHYTIPVINTTPTPANIAPPASYTSFISASANGAVPVTSPFAPASHLSANYGPYSSDDSSRQTSHANATLGQSSNSNMESQYQPPNGNISYTDLVDPGLSYQYSEPDGTETQVTQPFFNLDEYINTDGANALPHWPNYESRQPDSS